MIAAKKYGTIISYDLNYRPSLWKGIGGIEKAQQVNKRLARYVDVMIGNEEDFTASLGFEVEGVKYDRSLMNGCMKCHTEKKKFCDECHTYTSVKPYCWDCHYVPKETF